MVSADSPQKTRVGILFGGRSGEHEVSIVSAKSVFEFLDRDTYDSVPVYLDRGGKWYPHVTPERDLDISDKRESNPFQLLADEVDVVFPVLHGTYGEDGSMQGVLELLNVPYVGPGVVASAIAMDKAIFKRLMEAHDFPVAPWRCNRSPAPYETVT